MDSHIPKLQYESRRGPRETGDAEASVPASIMISCVKVAQRKPRPATISRIGGWNSDASRWQLSLDDAIAGIEQGKWSFYTLVNGQRMPVVIGQEPDGTKILKGESDGEQPTVLLGLPPLV